MKKNKEDSNQSWIISGTGYCVCMGARGYHRVAEMSNGRITIIAHVNKPSHDLKCTCRKPIIQYRDSQVDTSIKI